MSGDGKVPEGWRKEMLNRGDRAAFRGDDLHTIGMPVGGIGAGQLYLRGDGTLGRWWVFNRHHQTGFGGRCYRTYRPEAQVEQGFALVHGEGRETRPLNSDGFEDVAFMGEYPVGLVRYSDPGCPLEAELEAFSPFIPLNAPDSALPATVFRVTVRNTADHAVRAGVAGWLQNAVCYHTAHGIGARRRTELLRRDGMAILRHTAEPGPVPGVPQEPRPPEVLADFEGSDWGDWTAEGDAFGDGPASGSLPDQGEVTGFVGNGFANSFHGGNGPTGTLTSPEFVVSRRFVRFLIAGGNHAGETCINLLVDGDVVRTATGHNSERLEWDFWNVREFEGRKARIEIVDSVTYGWGHILVDQIELADEPRKTRGVPLEQLHDYGSMALALAEEMGDDGDRAKAVRSLSGDVPGLAEKVNGAYPVTERRSALLMPTLQRLEPGQSRTVTFVLAWFFPNHDHGRVYAQRFDGAAEVAENVLADRERLICETLAWHRTFYEDSTLPRWLLFRLHSTVANLASGTCEWWGNGRFWAWEGVGCCHGTCTHVWNYAQGHAWLFPEIARNIRERQDLGPAFHPDTGLVGFRGNSGYAADGQCGTVLKCYREHLMSPDYAFLRRNWPRIKKALQFSIEQDGDGNGLIEGRQHNTFDINFYGPNTFVGSLYLAALRAGEEMARRMGDVQFAGECRRIFESGRRLTEQTLWNGDYFVQQVDLEDHPRHQYGNGCLSDQLFGQGWAHQLGLGYLYDPEKVKRALLSVWRHNWKQDVGRYYARHRPSRYFARDGDAGLLTCTWPNSDYMSDGVRYKNEVWTGIEYQVAGHMVREGMVEEGLAICRGIHERYHPAGHNPFNEVECGDHYARALASWGLYTGLLGFDCDGPAGHIGFAPRLSPDDFRAAFTAPEGWGRYTQTRSGGGQTSRIEMRRGRLRLRSLSLGLAAGMEAREVTVGHMGERLMVETGRAEDRLRLRFERELVLGTGESLEVVVR